MALVLLQRLAPEQDPHAPHRLAELVERARSDVPGPQTQDQPATRPLLHRGRAHRGQQRGPGPDGEHARPQEQTARLPAEHPEGKESVTARDLGQEDRRVARGFGGAHDRGEVAPGQRIAHREAGSARLSSQRHAWHRPTHGTRAVRDRGRRVARGRAAAARDAAVSARP